MPTNLSTKDMSMKKNLGSLPFVLFLVFFSLLNADESELCSYSIESSKQSGVINEPFSVTFTTRQKTLNEVMFFDLKPKKSELYEVVSIKEKRHEFNYHDAMKEFEFLVIPKHSGVIKVAFAFQVRRASDDAVAQAYTGSRDNVKSIPTVNVHVADPYVELNITELPSQVQAVGEFNLVMELTKRKSSSYDAINVTYRVQGRGYLEESFEPIQEIEGVSIFRGKKERAPRATKEGYIYEKEWSYALVAKKDFQLPKVVLHSYNYRTKRLQQKSTQAVDIEITPLAIESLLDESEAPSSTLEYKKYLGYLYNLLIFIAGFLAAKFLERLPKKISKEADSYQSIANAKTPKETLKATLALQKNTLLHKEITELEALVYGGKSKKSLSEIKKSILGRLP